MAVNEEVGDRNPWLRLPPPTGRIDDELLLISETFEGVQAGTALPSCVALGVPQSAIDSL